eukprot:GILK01007152.1.p1 GENE.GILK01007152.1~~GILK01007152.1.p1  ORF type:complete len:352 (+),score=44.87 GILK01007152.1:47-1057(+)
MTITCVCSLSPTKFAVLLNDGAPSYNSRFDIVDVTEQDVFMPATSSGVSLPASLNGDNDAAHLQQLPDHNVLCTNASGRRWKLSISSESNDVMCTELPAIPNTMDQDDEDFCGPVITCFTGRSLVVASQLDFGSLRTLHIDTMSEIDIKKIHDMHHLDLDEDRRLLADVFKSERMTGLAIFELNSENCLSEPTNCFETDKPMSHTFPSFAKSFPFVLVATCLDDRLSEVLVRAYDFKTRVLQWKTKLPGVSGPLAHFALDRCEINNNEKVVLGVSKHVLVLNMADGAVEQSVEVANKMAADEYITCIRCVPSTGDVVVCTTQRQIARLHIFECSQD